MGYSAGQRPNGFHFLGLPKLVLQLTLFLIGTDPGAYVSAVGKKADFLIKYQDICRNFDMYNLTIFFCEDASQSNGSPVPSVFE